jgi:hypothetical protein
VAASTESLTPRRRAIREIVLFGIAGGLLLAILELTEYRFLVIPLTSFAVDDIRKEHARMEKLGVVFRTPPTGAGPVTIAVFEDTCGNLIQIVQL